MDLLEADEPDPAYWCNHCGLLAVALVLVLACCAFQQWRIYKRDRLLEICNRELRVESEQHDAAVQQLMRVTAEAAALKKLRP